MIAGRELDALVAEKVMGWKNISWTEVSFDSHRGFGQPPTDSHRRAFPDYSTDIAAAWEVVEKLQAEGWAIILDNMEGCLGHWQAHFERDRAVRVADADTAPHAICLAALKVVGALNE